jgi:hypothetical protein
LHVQTIFMFHYILRNHLLKKKIEEDQRIETSSYQSTLDCPKKLQQIEKYELISN